jgi:hypothetical protein
VRVLILTSDKTSWALQSWFYLANKYWPHHPYVLVGGYTKPDFLPPENFFYIGEFFDYPINHWSNGLIKFLSSIDDECFIWSMDDFWFTRRVNHEAVETLFDHALRHKELARIDLSHDRAGAASPFDQLLDPAALTWPNPKTVSAPFPMGAFAP